jgi:hypothetical protein
MGRYVTSCRRAELGDGAHWTNSCQDAVAVFWIVLGTAMFQKLFWMAQYVHEGNQFNQVQPAEHQEKHS